MFGNSLFQREVIQAAAAIGVIAQADATAGRPAPTAVGASAQALSDLTAHVDRLALVMQAVWSLVREKTNLTEEDLMVRVQAIDLMDGAADGKVTRQVAKCESCGRTMSTRHTKCLYCGAEKLVTSAFEKV